MKTKDGAPAAPAAEARPQQQDLAGPDGTTLRPPKYADLEKKGMEYLELKDRMKGVKKLVDQCQDSLAAMMKRHGETVYGWGAAGTRFVMTLRDVEKVTVETTATGKKSMRAKAKKKK